MTKNTESQTIKNVIFDLGGVLVDFGGIRTMEKYMDTAKAQKIFPFYFPDMWNLYDQGRITLEEMKQRGRNQFPEDAGILENWLSQWFYDLTPIKRNVQAAHQLKNQGYSIYVLSNIPAEAYAYLKAEGLFDEFEGGIYSFLPQFNKPDLRIYQLLLDKYGLDPKECLFIDDHQENCEAGRQMGIQTLHLEKPDELPFLLEKLCREE